MPIIKSVRGKSPKIHPTCYIADNATVIGDVEIGENSSIWFNVVVRGDVNYIKIGKNTNIQDGTVIHATYEKTPTIIGDNVTVGHNAILHACTVEDNVLVGMGAILMDNVIVHSGAIIAAGSVVTPGTEVEANTVYAGVPAEKVKVLEPVRAKEQILRYANNYKMYSQWYKDQENS